MKVHLLDADEPIREGRDYSATCGAPVKNAIFAFAIDAELMTDGPKLLSALTTCGKCLEEPKAKRYLYGLISGQEAKVPE